MIQNFYDHDIFLYIIGGLCCLGIAMKLGLLYLYLRLIRASESMATTNKYWMKNMKLRFVTCYQLKIGVNNVDLFVDKHVNKNKFCGVLLSTWEILSGQTIALSLAIGSFAGISGLVYNCGKAAILFTFFSGAWAAIIVNIVDNVVNIPAHKQLLKLNLKDYFENYLKVRLEQEYGKLSVSKENEVESLSEVAATGYDKRQAAEVESACFSRNEHKHELKMQKKMEAKREKESKQERKRLDMLDRETQIVQKEVARLRRRGEEKMEKMDKKQAHHEKKQAKKDDFKKERQLRLQENEQEEERSLREWEETRKAKLVKKVEEKQAKLVKKEEEKQAEFVKKEKEKQEKSDKKDQAKQEKIAKKDQAKQAKITKKDQKKQEKLAEKDQAEQAKRTKIEEVKQAKRVKIEEAEQANRVKIEEAEQANRVKIEEAEQAKQAKINKKDEKKQRINDKKNEEVILSQKERDRLKEQTLRQGQKAYIEKMRLKEDKQRETIRNIVIQPSIEQPKKIKLNVEDQYHLESAEDIISSLVGERNKEKGFVRSVQEASRGKMNFGEYEPAELLATSKEEDELIEEVLREFLM